MKLPLTAGAMFLATWINHAQAAEFCPVQTEIYFAPGHSELDENSKAQLDNLAKITANCSAGRISVLARASGSNGVEDAIDRANSVATALRARGLTKRAIVVGVAEESLAKRRASPTRVTIYTRPRERSKAYFAPARFNTPEPI